MRSLSHYPKENILVNDLAEKLYLRERTSIFLQTNDPSLVNMLSVRLAFDSLIDSIPELDVYLASDADIIHNAAYESALVKLRRGEMLSRRKKEMLGVFKTDGSGTTNEATVSNESFEDQMKRKIKAAKTGNNEYKSTFHVSPTANIVERLFSRAGHIMRPTRRHMDPSTLEMVLMLHMNKHAWSRETLRKF